MVVKGLAFAAGVVLLHACAAVPAPGVLMVLLSLAAPLCLWPRLRPLACLAAGFLWAGWQVQALQARHLPAELAGRDLQVQGVVVGLPQRPARGSARFTFHIDHYRHAGGHWRALRLPVQLYWYRRAPALAAGQRWQLEVRLKDPRGFANPGGFDRERHLLVARIRATGYVRARGVNRRLATGACCRVDRWRGRLSAFVDTHLDGVPAGLVRALAVGDRGGLDGSAWRVLRITGTAHLMAISGLHIGLVAGFVLLLVRRLPGVGRLAGGRPLLVIAAPAALLAASFYALAAGFGLPAQRALLMVAVFTVTAVLRRPAGLGRALVLALVVVLLRDPLAVLAPGFWLSFGAVAWIFYATVGRYGRRGRLAALLHLQGVLALGLLPVSLAGFQQWPLLSPLANLVAVPWTGLLAVPLVLLGVVAFPLSTPLAAMLFDAAGAVLALLWALLAWLAAWPAVLWQHALPAVWVLLPVAAGLLLALAPAGVPARAAALGLLAPLLLVAPPRPPAGAVWLSVLDVGQGLAAVVRTRHHVLVYDAGPRFASGFDTGAAVVVPFLRQAGVRRVDRLLVSHSDNDHIGGARSLFEALDTGSILSGTPAAIGWARARACRRGQAWRWDGVRFEILAPWRARRGNNASCVLRVTSAAGQRLLLPGDIEAAVERWLVAEEGEALHSEVLVAPHHGSRTSSTQTFVAAVRPDEVIFAAGHDNRFGFPRPEVVARYRALGARVHATGEEGAVQVRLHARGGPPEVVSWRRRQPRHWRSPPRP